MHENKVKTEVDQETKSVSLYIAIENCTMMLEITYKFLNMYVDIYWDKHKLKVGIPRIRVQNTLSVFYKKKML